MPAKHFIYNDSANGAPEPLEQVRGFLNSVDLEAVAAEQAEDRLVQWCRTSGLVPDPEETDLRELAAFREALRVAAEANAGFGEQQPAWAGLTQFAQRSRFTAATGERGLELVAVGTGVELAIGTILAIVIRSQIDGTWARFKACRKHSCRWAFYDRSKNGSGTWCSMAVCGNRVKAAKRRGKRPA